MNNKENKNEKEGGLSRSARLFEETSLWKTVAIMIAPMALLMLFTGAFLFSDSLLAINLAGKSYVKEASSMHLHASSLVRLFMAGAAPISTVIMALIFLFSVGISSRVQVNRGRGDMERAKSTLKVGMTLGMIIAFLAMPILILVSKAWISSQFANDGPQAVAMNKLITQQGYNYIFIIIFSLPFQVFNQSVSAQLRNEARNKEMLVAMILPILTNLFLDWALMGPGKMDIQGGAIATLASYVISTFVLIFFIYRKEDSMLKFKNMFGLKLRYIGLIGIVLIGLAPFIRNMANSLTQTLEMATIKDISKVVYHDPNKMTIAFTGAGPVFFLFFPVMFSPIQAGRPIASYNYGKGNIDRVKKTYWVTLLYTIILASLIYVIVVFGLGKTLLRALKVAPENIPLSINILRIFMLIIFPFSLIVGTMLLTGSTDRIVLNLLTNCLRGFILFFPMLYLFKYLSLHNPNIQLLFWWFYPAVGGSSAIFALFIALYVYKSLDKSHHTLEQTLDIIYAKFGSEKALERMANWDKEQAENKLKANIETAQIKEE